MCAFSLGLASVLGTLALLAIYAYQWLEGFPTKTETTKKA